MAGQWQSSTSVVSVRSTAEDKDNSPVDSVVAQLVLLHPDGATASLDATVLLDRPGRLQLISPLANTDVDFPGAIVVSSESTSLDIGPEVFLRAASIELAGASLQVSKDTSAGDPAGSTAELEVAESFVTSAALIGNVSVNDLSIVLPSTHKLSYPWVRYRAEPEDHRDSGGTDDRSRRLMSNLMSLARRLGHGASVPCTSRSWRAARGSPHPISRERSRRSSATECFVGKATCSSSPQSGTGTGTTARVMRACRRMSTNTISGTRASQRFFSSRMILQIHLGERDERLGSVRLVRWIDLAPAGLPGEALHAVPAVHPLTDRPGHAGDRRAPFRRSSAAAISLVETSSPSASASIRSIRCIGSPDSLNMRRTRCSVHPSSGPDRRGG